MIPSSKPAWPKAISPPAPPTALAATSSKGPQAPMPVDAHYDSARMRYHVTDEDDNWMMVDSTGLKHRLAQKGLRGRLVRDELITPADAMMVRIQHERHVQYAGGLAGFKRGVHVVNKAKVLVTSSPEMLVARKGPWDMLRHLIEQQIAPQDPLDPPQCAYYHTLLKLWDNELRACLEKGHVTYGQALIMVGPVGCGKSLLQKIITQMLGGRSASPFKFMSGRTEFNHELFLAEHLAIEDEQPHKDIKSRVLFGDAIKQITATTDHPYFGKSKDGRTLTPFWRLSVSAQDEQDHLEVLPPLSDIADKVVLLHCRKEPMPMPCGTAAEKELFWVRLMADLPGYLWWLRHEWEMPRELAGERYSLASFVHPRIVTMMDDILPEMRLLSLVDHVLFMDGLAEWYGTAEELSRQLMESPAYGPQARSTTSNGNMCGRLLGKLARSRPDRVVEHRCMDERKWKLTKPATPMAPMTPPPIQNRLAQPDFGA